MSEIYEQVRQNKDTSPIKVTPQAKPSGYCRFKGLIGRVLGAILILPGLPIVGVLVLLVRATSKGPGIYRQQRLGKNGQPFDLLKIRTMTVDAEQHGVQWTSQNDQRITTLGKWLRRLHLDELPQLINVIRGDMTLIGPRPERPEFVRVLQRQITNYDDRMAIPPGITGLAQINLPPDEDIASVRHKLVLDREYIENASAMLDCRIFLCTFLRIIGLSGDRAMRLCGVRREVKPLSQVETNEVVASKCQCETNEEFHFASVSKPIVARTHAKTA